MNKTSSLRAALLAAIVGTDDKGRAVKLQPEDLKIYIEKGRIQSTYSAQPSNEHFRNTYDINLIVFDYAHSLNALIHIILRWMSENHRGHSDEALKYEADLLDNSTADVHIIIEDVRETVKVSHSDTGTSLSSCKEQPIDPILSTEPLSVNLNSANEPAE